MMKRTHLSLCLGAALATLAGTAGAQDAQKLDRVEVTGSRLIKLTTDSPSPLQVITGEEIAKSGVANIQDLLLKNPTTGTPGLSRTNSNFLTSGGGVATVDLRGLGSDRTLVLVNGRRFVSGVPTALQVDLNTIPADFIERVEILTGGASAAYGSDAVAGVVNIILKKSFEGVAIDLQRGESWKNDDKKTKLSMTYGANSGDGKANMMMHFGYTKQGVVYAKDRDGMALDSASTGVNITGDWHDILSATSPFFSSFAPQGRIFPNAGSTAGSRTFDANGNIIPFSTNGPAGDGVGATGYNRQAFRTLAVPTERYLFAGKGEVAVSDNHNLFIEGTYAQSKTKTRIEPFALDSVNILPATGGRAAAEQFVNGVKVANPLVPAGIMALLKDTDGDGLKDYGFTRRLAEVGTRGATADRDTFHVVAGGNGNLKGSWDYDFYASYGSTKEAQQGGGQVNVLNFRNALNAIPDANDVNGNGNRTEAICMDANARAQGCVPISIFGFNSITPGALAYINAPTSLTTTTTQKVVAATVRGELMDLPAGPWGLAVGAEYREEYSKSEFDALTQAGLNAGNAQPTIEGKYDVKELFVETRVPLLKKLPGIHELSATGTARRGKYSTVGNTTSWNAGLEYAPFADLKFRAAKALSTRAPNVGELFSPPQQTFPSGISDPCVGVTATSTGTFDAACRADPGVAANIAANGRFTLTQPDLQGISGFNSGNLNLQEEKGHSTTFGFVYMPKGIELLRNVTITMDYFDVKIDDAIVSTPRQFILQQCYSGNGAYCQFVTRRPAAVGPNSAGSIAFLNSASTNSGGFATKGIDLTLNWAGRVGPGNLSSRLSYTHVIDGYTIPLPGSAKDYFAGEVGAAKDKFTLNLGYTYQGWGVNTTVTYIGKSALDDQFLAQFNIDPNDGNSDTLPRGFIKVPSKTYTDLQLNYTWGKARFYVGLDNAFNVKPPFIPGGVPSNVTGTTTDAGTYDAIGRRYYAGVRFSL